MFLRFLAPRHHPSPSGRILTSRRAGDMSNKHPAHCVSEATHVVTVEDRRPFVVNHQCLCTNFMAPEKSYVLEHVAHRRSRTFESRDLFYRAREACRISIALRRHIE